MAGDADDGEIGVNTVDRTTSSCSNAAKRVQKKALERSEGCSFEDASVCDQLRHTPVLEAAVWKIPTDGERNFPLGQLLDRNLQSIGLAV